MPATEPLYLSTQADDESDTQHPEMDDGGPPEGGEGNEDDGGGDGDRDPSRWVTVATFWQPTDAHMARLKLESEAIDCFLMDENLVATDWLYANAVGGIKLRVPEADAARARQLLTERPPRIARSADAPAVSEELATDPTLRCPECGSTEIDRPFLHRRNIWAIAVMMLLATTVLFIVLPVLLVIYFIWLRPYRCRACDNVWNATEGRRGFDLTPCAGTPGKARGESSSS